MKSTTYAAKKMVEEHFGFLIYINALALVISTDKGRTDDEF